jgi:hypothetical protein
MIQPTIRSLIENPGTGAAFEALCDDDASSFSVDWREEDDAILRDCEDVLKTGMLSADLEDDQLFIQFGQKRVRVPLTYSEADRHITLVTLNAVLHPDFEVRYVMASYGSDTLAFVPLPRADWLALEKQYGLAKVRAAFGTIRKSPDLFTYPIDDPQPGAEDQSRRLTADDLLDVQPMFGWQFWIAPIIFTVGYLVAAPVAWFVMDRDLIAQGICLVVFGGLAGWAWSNRLREHRKFAQDKSVGLVQTIEGAPERVDRVKDGRCYVSIAGRKVRVAPEYYNELRDANNVKIEFLPESSVAVRVNVIRGLGI